MTTMISTGLDRYDGKVLKLGQRFDVADERHVRTLQLARKAKLAETDEAKRTYRRRDMKAED